MTTTRRDRKALGKYLRRLANEVGLRDWTIVLGADEETGEGRAAQFDPRTSQKEATITFRAGWRSWDREYLRDTAVHELLHCHLTFMDQLIIELDAHMGQPVYQLLCTAHRQHLEVACDGMAREWARRLPLIEWPAPIKRKPRSASTPPA